jgi:hypothetical protein
VDYFKLYQELTTDAPGYGYAPMVAAQDWAGLAALLNTVRDGSSGTAIVRRRANIRASEVLEAIDYRDFKDAPNPSLVAWFQSATQLSAIRLLTDDGQNTRALGNIRALISAPADQVYFGSFGRINQIANEFISRATQLGLGSVQGSDVAEAFRLAPIEGW